MKTNYQAVPISTIAIDLGGRADLFRQYSGEPRLDDLFDDPVLRAVMTRDGITRDVLMELVFMIQSKLKR